MDDIWADFAELGLEIMGVYGRICWLERGKREARNRCAACLLMPLGLCISEILAVMCSVQSALFSLRYLCLLARPITKQVSLVE